MKSKKRVVKAKFGDTFMLLLKAFGKLSRDESNALRGIYDSYRKEAEYWREKYEKLHLPKREERKR